MRKFPRLAALCITLLAVASAGSSSAGEKRKKKKKKEPESHPTVITSVAPGAITIREAKVEKTVVITPATEIYVRGQKADIAALQSGMAVSITLAMDRDKASRINASDPPPVREGDDRKRKAKARR